MPHTFFFFGKNSTSPNSNTNKQSRKAYSIETWHGFRRPAERQIFHFLSFAKILMWSRPGCKQNWGLSWNGRGVVVWSWATHRWSIFSWILEGISLRHCVCLATIDESINFVLTALTLSVLCRDSGCVESPTLIKLFSTARQLNNSRFDKKKKKKN